MPTCTISVTGQCRHHAVVVISSNVAAPDHGGAVGRPDRAENGGLIICADVPGIKPDVVKIGVEDDLLTISGSHEEHTKEQHKRYVRHERRRGPFSRSMPAPAGVDAARSRQRRTTAWSR
jgi:Hsp20/alpha crystallin family